MIDNTSTVTSPFGVQKIGKGKSPVLPKEKDSSYNLRDRLNDTLSSEKYIIESYTTGSKEILCEKLYTLVNNNLNSIKQLHRHLFEEIFNLGEYQADLATQQQVDDALDMFTKYQAQFPYSQS
ncbi:MAG: spore coat protein [Peptococcaceae bacterium]|nr:spore coat protein [Peptococcaceae bacterium]